jgi:hypothetical protein
MIVSKLSDGAGISEIFSNTLQNHPLATIILSLLSFRLLLPFRPVQEESGVSTRHFGINDKRIVTRRNLWILLHREGNIEARFGMGRGGVPGFFNDDVGKAGRLTRAEF